MKVAVLAAGGHTGRMVVEQLRARGADVRPLTRREADAGDRAAVRAAIAGCDALVNLAGPFLRTGLAPVEAAIDARVAYVDTTGEQAFMAQVRERLDARARAEGVAVVNAMAYEYALGDLAARAFFPEGGDALHVLYRSPGARASAGTKKSVLRVMGAPTLAFEGGRLARAHAARHRRTFPTRDGPRTGASFAGGEVLTVPAHTPFRTVRTYVATRHPGRARLLAPVARIALRGALLRAAERLVDATHHAPSNDAARGEVHLVAEPSGRHVVVTTPDPYLATAHVAAEGALRLARAGEAGVLAPAQAFDASDFLESMRKAVPGFDAAPFPSSS
ncbi:MAG TPA: saccharopine dehydrogenase NADP-binding domain-containing protein [Candidatus Thermoplasmatota archaeon]|nr:saccharopine dehydrogenase NADP-binding domain-containing protein [Candidatus Thermoplasmatota archaeon]